MKCVETRWERKGFGSQSAKGENSDGLRGSAPASSTLRSRMTTRCFLAPSMKFAPSQPDGGQLKKEPVCSLPPINRVENEMPSQQKKEETICTGLSRQTASVKSRAGQVANAASSVRPACRLASFLA